MSCDSLLVREINRQEVALVLSVHSTWKMVQNKCQTLREKIRLQK
jgi:hypothetical protein